MRVRVRVGVRIGVRMGVAQRRGARGVRGVARVAQRGAVHRGRLPAKPAGECGVVGGERELHVALGAREHDVDLLGVRVRVRVRVRVKVRVRVRVRVGVRVRLRGRRGWSRGRGSAGSRWACPPPPE